MRPALAWFGFARGASRVGGVVSALSCSPGRRPAHVGGEFGWIAGFALWIGSIALGATMLAIGDFPLPVGLAITIAAPLAMIGLPAGLPMSPPKRLDLVVRAGIVLFGLGWSGAGLSLLAAQPAEGVLGTA